MDVRMSWHICPSCIVVCSATRCVMIMLSELFSVVFKDLLGVWIGRACQDWSHRHVGMLVWMFGLLCVWLAFACHISFLQSAACWAACVWMFVVHYCIVLVLRALFVFCLVHKFAVLCCMIFVLFCLSVSDWCVIPSTFAFVCGSWLRLHLLAWCALLSVH